MGEAVTNDKLYDAIQNVRLELKADIKSVDDKVNRVMTAQAVDKTKLGTLVAGITVIVSAVVTVIVAKIVGKQ